METKIKIEYFDAIEPVNLFMNIAQYFHTHQTHLLLKSDVESYRAENGIIHFKARVRIAYTINNDTSRTS
jgi:hypothetical protein